MSSKDIIPSKDSKNANVIQEAGRLIKLAWLARKIFLLNYRNSLRLKATHKDQGRMNKKLRCLKKNKNKKKIDLKKKILQPAKH